MTLANQLRLSGRLLELAPLRYTPAGIPIAGGRLAHESEQVEANTARRVEVEVEFVLAGGQANLLARAPLGSRLCATGFITAKAKTRLQLVFHIVEFELDGVTDGN